MVASSERTKVETGIANNQERKVQVSGETSSHPRSLDAEDIQSMYEPPRRSRSQVESRADEDF